MWIKILVITYEVVTIFTQKVLSNNLLVNSDHIIVKVNVLRSQACHCELLPHA